MGPPASRSCTTSCSTCAEASGSSRRSATPGPTPTSSRRSTTRTAPRGASPTAARRRRSSSGCGRAPARSGRCSRSTRYAIESLDLRGYDIVVSSSSAWAHGVLPGPGAVHVCYCHNPFRYAWSEHQATLAAGRRPSASPLSIVLSSAGGGGTGRRAAGGSVRGELAGSPPRASAATSAARPSAVPAGGARRASRPGAVGDHYLVVAELMAHKRIDVAVEAFTGSACRSSSSATVPRCAACAGSRDRA